MDRRTFLIALVTIMLWSTAFPSIRAGLLGGYTPSHLALLRFIVASLVFIIYACLPQVKFQLPKKQHLLQIALLGLTGFSIYHLALAYGQQTVTAGVASFIIGSTPIFTALIAHFILHEKLRAMSWVGLIIGLTGIGMVSLGTSEEGFSVDTGIFFILIAAIATSIFFVFQKPLFKHYKPFELVAYFTWIGTIPFFLFLPGFINTVQQATIEATLATIALGIFPGAIAYALWSLALSLGNANTVSTMLYVQPVFVIIISWFWLKEWPSNLSLMGGIIAILSVCFINIIERQQLKRPKKQQAKSS